MNLALVNWKNSIKRAEQEMAVEFTAERRRLNNAKHMDDAALVEASAIAGLNAFDTRYARMKSIVDTRGVHCGDPDLNRLCMHLLGHPPSPFGCMF